MNTIKLSIDSQSFASKPSGQDIPNISTQMAKSPKTYNLSEINDFIDSVGTKGHTFCPATFKNGKRSKENFEQQQIFALDFDNKDPKQIISFEEVKMRANQYNLPVLFAYDTFSSTKDDKFRVIFLNNASICHRKVVEAIQLALGTIFHEADPSCIKDVSKMYFGGKKIIFRNENIPTINVESVFRALTYYLEDQYKNHYREKIMKFADTTGIALNNKGLIDVLTSDEPFNTAHLTEKDSGALTSNQNGNFSPNTIYYYIMVEEKVCRR